MDGTAVTKGRPATYQQILDLPEHLVGELMDDELIAHPRPFLAHAVILRRLGQELDPFDRRSATPGGWLLCFEPEIHLGSHIVVPDMAGWRLERLPKVPKNRHPTVAPDWVCEVLSEGTARYDRLRKPRIYGRHGVAWYWLIDPKERSLEVIALAADRWTTMAVFEEAEEVVAPPFEAVRFPLSALWPVEE